MYLTTRLKLLIVSQFFLYYVQDRDYETNKKVRRLPRLSSGSVAINKMNEYLSTVN